MKGSYKDQSKLKRHLHEQQSVTQDWESDTLI